MSNFSTNVISAWSGANVQFYQKSDMRNVVLLDNQSTVSLFCNRKFVENVWRVEEPLELVTNGGHLYTNLKAKVPGYGEVWFHPKSITNIFGFAEMEDKHPITHDTNCEKTFNVRLADKVVKFKRSENGLYYFVPPFNNKQQSCGTNIPMESVEENIKMFITWQIERAKLTRKIYYALGTP
jgi:hypothetical protein